MACADLSTCHRCDGPTRKMRDRHLGEPYWWCPRCYIAYQCACEGCQVIRALAAMGLTT
jgi:hypothetical protein